MPIQKFKDPILYSGGDEMKKYTMNLHYKLEELIQGVNAIEEWIKNHEKLTLARFDDELAALIRHPESKAGKALAEIQSTSLGSSTGGNLIQ